MFTGVSVLWLCFSHAQKVRRVVASVGEKWINHLLGTSLCVPCSSCGRLGTKSIIFTGRIAVVIVHYRAMTKLYMLRSTWLISVHCGLSN